MTGDHEATYRTILGALMAVGFAVSAWYRGRADRLGGRVCRREDGTLLGLALLGSGLAAVGGLLAFLANPRWMDWSQLPLPDWARMAGLPVGVMSLVLFQRVFAALGRNVTPTGQVRQDHTLVTHGPYRYVRHPMYATAVVNFAAYFLLTANWFIAAMCVITFAILAHRTDREEANLLDRFGERYRRYARETPRFLPRLRAEPRRRVAQNGS